MRTRAYRRHQRARTKARHLRDHYALIWDPSNFGPRKDIAERHPMDCGKRCWLCHYDKLSGTRPPRETLDWLRAERDAWGD